MSIQVRTADMIIMPSSNESSNGRVYRTTDVMEPVTYNVEFSDEGGIPVPQLEALFDECAKKRESVEIKFSQKKVVSVKFLLFTILSLSLKTM